MKHDQNIPIPTNPTVPQRTPDEHGSVGVQGHIKIFDPETKEVYINKRNAIHYENFSIALARSIGGQSAGPIYEMAFGNGGTRIDQTGLITYLTPRVVGSSADLYNQTYQKSVFPWNSADNTNRSYMETRHLAGAYYTDVLISCLLGFGEPIGQAAFDNSATTENAYIFDEIGLKAVNAVNGANRDLLTHVIFHPVQKSMNRMIQIDYTIRIQSLSGVV
jgi:hypothetical protein